MGGLAALRALDHLLGRAVAVVVAKDGGQRELSSSPAGLWDAMLSLDVISMAPGRCRGQNSRDGVDGALGERLPSAVSRGGGSRNPPPCLRLSAPGKARGCDHSLRDRRRSVD